MASTEVIPDSLAIGVLFVCTAFGADSSTSNVTQIASMEPFQLEEWGSFWTVDLQGERLFAAYAEVGHHWESSIDTDRTKSGRIFARS